MCDFWESVHQIFLQDIQSFDSEVFTVSLSQLTQNSATTLEKAANFCGLRSRAAALSYPDKPNIPGKGLRNVVDGEIKVVADIETSPIFALSSEECKYVQNRLFPLYYTLTQRRQSE